MNDWMFGYGVEYTEDMYAQMKIDVRRQFELRTELKFLLPAFPCKSCSKKKVIGSNVDYAEFLAIQNILTTLRNLLKAYPFGITFTIISDYHTFAPYIGVTQQNYDAYHQGLKAIIERLGGGDALKLTCLKDYPEFENIPSEKICEHLTHQFGEKEFLLNFDQRLKTDADFLAKYTQMRRFMHEDQRDNFPGTPRSKATASFVKNLARGMMNQGVALDNFLRCHAKEHIRLSIHNHNPSGGKYAIDLYKLTNFRNSDSDTGSKSHLVSPWHNALCFDAKNGKMLIEHHETFHASKSGEVEFVPVTYLGQVWMYFSVAKSNGSMEIDPVSTMTAELVGPDYGLIITSNGNALNWMSTDEDCLNMMVVKFGAIILRGFKETGDVDSTNRLRRHQEWAKNNCLNTDTMQRRHFLYIKDCDIRIPNARNI